MRRAGVVGVVLAMVLAGLGPGLASADFEDSTEGVHAPDVAALAQLGVFEGTECGDGLFCPDEPLLRRDMAVWLVRVLALRDPLPEGWASWQPPVESRFGDVADDAWWMASVERLADVGVTLGCSAEPAMYCPDRPVTRAQMASFLRRAFALDLPVGPSGFIDIDGSVHAADIGALAASGITAGCATEPLRFCPGDPTTRAQMATFLKRAYTAYIGPCPTETQEPEATTGGGGGGAGPAARASAVPRTVPDAPLSLNATPGDETITLDWQAPASDGGAAVTGYRVQWRASAETFSTDRQADAAGTTHRITSLTNGTQYWVQVQALNAAGPGSAARASATPRSVPDAPTNVEVSPGDGTLLLSWDPPASDGGAAITGYRVQWKGPAEAFSDNERTTSVTDRRHQITGLEKGTEYTVRVQAQNALGLGAAFEGVKVAVAPPGAPSSGSVSVFNRNLLTSWTAPAGGGAPIVRYEVYWKGPDEDYDTSRCSLKRIVVNAGGTLQALVGPLTNGTSYGMRVVAVNASGPGAPLDLTGTPAAVPGRPEPLDAFAVDGGLLINWSKPWDGGSAITGYRLQWKGPNQQYNTTDRQATLGAAALSHELSGLTNGTKYTVRAVAVNANGDSYFTETTGTPADTPGAPRSFSAVLGTPTRSPHDVLYTVGLSWRPPADAGGSAVTGYRVDWRNTHARTRGTEADLRAGQVTPEGSVSLERWRRGYNYYLICTADQSRSDCDEYTYVFRVFAINSNGAGPPAVITSKLA